MIILLLTIPVTITLVILFVIFFIASVKGRQFEDLETPKHTPFSDDEDLDIEEEKLTVQEKI